MSENNKMPELAPTDIVQLRDGRYGIVLMNDKATLKGLSVFTYYPDRLRVSCIWHLDNYTNNICKKEHCSDIIKIWKANAQTQFSLVSTFFNDHCVPLYAKPDWVEPKPSKKMTLKEIEEILGYPITIVEEHSEGNEYE